MLAGDVVEAVAASVVAVAVAIIVLALSGGLVGLGSGLLVGGLYLAYAAQGLATVEMPKIRWRRAIKRTASDPKKLGPKKPTLKWLPKECTWDEFKVALAKELDELAVTQVTAGMELQRLRAGGVVKVTDDNKIVRV